MPLSYLRDQDYSLGMFRDVPSWQIPSGGVYDSLNMAWDKTGIARQRMGSTALVSGAQTAFATSLGFAYSQDATPIEELYGANGKTGDIFLINKTTGAANVVGAPGFTGIFGRPARHFGFLVFPLLANLRKAITVAGQTTNASFTNTVAVTLTANQQQITLTGADTTTNIKVGAIIGAGDGFGIGYYGRVVSIDSGTKFTVWPAPPVTFTTTTGALGLSTQSFTQAVGGACAASFQNRLLLGNTNDLRSTGTTLISDRRVIYSVLPTEVSINSIGVQYTGATFMAPLTYPPLNYFDVPGADPIIAMEPVGRNQLLILTSTHPVVFSGDLVTETGTTSPTVTFDISDINVNASCLSDLSVQRTRKGIVWAGAGGIYAWDGREPIDLTTGTMNTFWRAKVRGSNFAVHGAVYVRGYYILSYTSGGVTEALVADLTGKAPKWGRMSGVGTDNFYGAERPTDASQVFAIRWFDQVGAAPSMTNGQTLRLESMLASYVSGTTTDADGTAVTIGLQTRTITGDAETQKMFQRGVVEYQEAATVSLVSVTAQSTIDAADVDASRTRTLGNLSSTATSTITTATNASPIVITTSAAHGLQTDDFVDIDAVTGNTNANGQYRVNVTSTTQFSLVGSAGNAAYAGGGKVKKRTEQTFPMSPLNKGQGASLTFSGSPNNFELHAVKLAVLQQEPVPA